MTAITKKRSNFFTVLEQKWASLLPKPIKQILPQWQVLAGISTLIALYGNDQVYNTMIALFWASISFALVFRKVNQYIRLAYWIIPAFHAVLSFLIISPASAQVSGSACSSNGLFATVTNYVDTLFSSVSFGGVGGGTLSSLICTVVGFLTVALLLGFLGVIGYVAFQIGYQRQPISTVLDPLMAFLVFAGGSTVIISVMVGGAA
jgi:hypothetical protein